MKYIDINKRFTEIVNECLSNGLHAARRAPQFSKR